MIPCETCLKLPICKGKRTIACDDLINMLTNGMTTDEQIAFASIFKWKEHEAREITGEKANTRFALTERKFQYE